jgi:hypothetical protein
MYIAWYDYRPRVREVTPYYLRPALVRRSGVLFERSIVPLVPVSLWRNVSTNPELSLYAAAASDAVRLVRMKAWSCRTRPT